MTLTLTIAGVSQTAFLQESSATCKLNTLDLTLVDPVTIPAPGDAVALTSPTWNGTVTAVRRRTGPRPGHDFATVTATNTVAAYASAAPFGLSDAPNGTTTFGWVPGSLSIVRATDTGGASFEADAYEADAYTTSTISAVSGTCTIFQTGLWPAMTFLLTSADLGYAGTSFTAQEVSVTWVKGVPRYDVTFGDPIVTMSVWLASQAADSILPITTTSITDGAVTTPKVAANAITAGQIAAGTITTTELDAGNIALYDSDGSTTALDGDGFGPTWRRFITSGLYNGDFIGLPPTPGANVDDTTNKIPHWPFARSSGTACTARSIADTSAASGRVIRFTMAAGAAGDDGYVEQLIPVNGSRGQSFVYDVIGTFLTSASINALEMFMESQYLLADGSTPTGSSYTSTRTTTAQGASTVGDSVSSNRVNGDGIMPSDAYFLRVRIGFQRGAAAAGVTGTVDLCEVRCEFGGSRTQYADALATFSAGSAFQSGGALHLVANERLSPSGQAPALVLDGSGTGAIRLVAQNGAGTLTWDGSTLTWPGGNISDVGETSHLQTSGDFRTAGLLATKAKAGTVNDTDFVGSVAQDGALGLDTTNHRLYFRRGTWHYVAETAGFQVPAEEAACPARGCGALLLPGEPVVGIIERVMDDGARHGLYVHLSCAGRGLDPSPPQT